MRDIILVEDSDADAELARQALVRLNVANPLRILRDGMQAWAYLTQVAHAASIGPQLPAVLFLDLKLPGMSGFEILQHIQKLPVFAEMLRIVLSNLDDTRSIKEAYALGAHSYLVKPFREADLAELIKAFPGYWSFKTGRVSRSEDLALKR